MKVQPAAILRTTLPLGIDMVEQYDTGRYYAIWLPDHIQSFWPDSIWTPEFTDLATTSHSPHRHLDAMAVAGAVAVLSQRAAIATSVIDTVRRHPVMLAQAALSLDHLSAGRFILGLGAGEAANTVPYGFDIARPAARYEEVLQVITLLWNSDGPANFEGEFFRLEGARLDAELHDGKPPRIWCAASGPRMLEIAGRYADGWWAAGAKTPEEYASQLGTLRASADRAGRDPQAIVPANIMRCLIGTDDEIDEMFHSPLIKCMLLTNTAEEFRLYGHEHPMGPTWRGHHDINPATLDHRTILDFCATVTKQAFLDIVPTGSPRKVAERFKGFVDAGMRVFRVNDWSAMAGSKFAPHSFAKVRQTEDELLSLVGPQ